MALQHPGPEPPDVGKIEAKTSEQAHAAERSVGDRTCAAGARSIAPAGTSLTTTALAPMRAPSPTLMAPRTLAPGPMETLSPISGQPPFPSPIVTCWKISQLPPITASALITTPLVCGIHRPPPILQRSGMLIPPTIDQKRQRTAAQRQRIAGRIPRLFRFACHKRMADRSDL